MQHAGPLLWHAGFLVAACKLLVAACKLLVAACMRDLVAQPGIEPGHPALGAQSLTHWATREVPPGSVESMSGELQLSMQPTLTRASSFTRKSRFL